MVARQPHLESDNQSPIIGKKVFLQLNYAECSCRPRVFHGDIDTIAHHILSNHSLECPIESFHSTITLWMTGGSVKFFLFLAFHTSIPQMSSIKHDSELVPRSERKAFRTPKNGTVFSTSRRAIRSAFRYQVPGM